MENYAFNLFARKAIFEFFKLKKRFSIKEGACWFTVG